QVEMDFRQRLEPVRFPAAMPAPAGDMHRGLDALERLLLPAGQLEHMPQVAQAPFFAAEIAELTYKRHRLLKAGFCLVETPQFERGNVGVAECRCLGTLVAV